MLFEDRRRAESFGAQADRYDRTRPSYPAALVDDLVAGRPDLVLDVGCGTGIAARLLAARGCRVLGVEPDGRMAAVARHHGIEVEGATFEAWAAGGRVFDLVTSGQAWHWVDPEAGAAKVADVLAPGGRIGVFWNMGGLPSDLRAAVDAVYEREAPDLDRFSVALGRAGRERFGMAAEVLQTSGRFVDVGVRTYPNPVTYTTASWLDQLTTHSDHAALPPARVQRLRQALAAVVDAAGGGFTMAYDTWLVSGTRMA